MYRMKNRHSFRELLKIAFYIAISVFKNNFKWELDDSKGKSKNRKMNHAQLKMGYELKKNSTDNQYGKAISCIPKHQYN